MYFMWKSVQLLYELTGHLKVASYDIRIGNGAGLFLKKKISKEENKKKI